MDALYRSLKLSEQIASTGVVVDARDDAARAFYRKYGVDQLFTRNRSDKGSVRSVHIVPRPEHLIVELLQRIATCVAAAGLCSVKIEQPWLDLKIYMPLLEHDLASWPGLLQWREFRGPPIANDGRALTSPLALNTLLSLTLESP